MKRLISILAVSFIYVCLALGQVQIGQDIDGEAAGDLGGVVSLSADGNTLAIGARGNGGNGENAGHARVYTWTGTDWVQKGLDIDGQAAGDGFGHSVSLSANGNHIAIGAPWNDSNGISSGHVRIYGWNGTSWVQMGQDIGGEAEEDRYGMAISLSADGNRLAIGAIDDDDNGWNSGHVRVYGWNGIAWSQLGQDIDGEAEHDWFGFSVSLSATGDRVAIGAPHNDGNGWDAGRTKIYEWDGISWVQLGQNIDAEGYNNISGFSVSLSADGNRIAVGAILNSGNGGYNAGHARVHEWDGNSWVQLGQDMDGEAPFDHCGTVSLSADGNRVAIGASLNDGNGTDAGHTRVYGWDGASWGQLGQDMDGEAAEDRFGGSISLSADGSRVAIGARYNDGNGTDAGHVRVFSIESVSVNNIFQQSVDISPNPSTGLFTIQLNKTYQNVDIEWLDVTGKILNKQAYANTSVIEYNCPFPSGVYFVRIRVSTGESGLFKVLKM